VSIFKTKGHTDLSTVIGEELLMIDPMVLHHEVKVETNSLLVIGTTTKQ
jgi:hypothetical protein